MRLKFLGGIDTVTGSQYLIEANGSSVLRDFGLFQGRRKVSREINEQTPENTGEIQSLVLSHAHIDHCGNIPTLVRNGFDSPVYATRVTADLCEIMLRDAANIQEQDAAYLNQKTNRKGLPEIVPIYTAEDADAALKLFRGTGYETITVAAGIEASFIEAGHILGAAMNIFTVRENGRESRIGFAVDLGRADLPIVRDPEVMEGIDILVMESTYGNREHEKAVEAEDQLCSVIKKTIERGGKVLIPSFALERAQALILHLASLYGEGKLPKIPVYVDSPMADKITRIYDDNVQYMNAAFHELKSRVEEVMRPEWVQFTSKVEESKKVTASDDPCIVIAASGMCEYGRILHHLKHGIESPKNTVVIVGFQARHTLGRRLVEKNDEVRIFGDTFKRRAEVEVLDAFSAHAGRKDLISYARKVNPRQIYLTHGEAEQRNALAEALRSEGFKDVFEPGKGDAVELN